MIDMKDIFSGTRACGKVEVARYCNHEVVGSSHIILMWGLISMSMLRGEWSVEEALKVDLKGI